MVGLLLVSHSKKLAEAVRELVLQMTSRDFPVAIASGVGDNHEELGTDAVHIADVLQQMDCPQGVLVLMDLGSAVLSAETALELLDSPNTKPVRLCPAPLVEGAIAAAVCAQAGGTLEDVAREAASGVVAKEQQLQTVPAATLPNQPQQSPTSPEETAELIVTLENQHGLHARPAAAFVQTVSRFSCACDVSNLTSGRGPVPARSLTSLALLQSRKGDRLRIVCSGSDSRAAVEAIGELAAANFGDRVEATPPPSAPTATTIRSGSTRGVAGSDGIAIGLLTILEEARLEPTAPAKTSAEELATLKAAMKSVGDAMDSGRASNSQAAATTSAILNAQALILRDPVVIAKLRSLIESDGMPAATAWTKLTGDLAAQYSAMDDPYLRERATDIRDIARRVLRQLAGDGTQTRIAFEKPGILCVDELLPSEADACDPATVIGVIATRGSATSHAAIILRTLGIPFVMGITGITPADVGRVVALDGSTGEVWLDPDEPTVTKLRNRQASQAQQKTLVEAARSKPAVTLDGVRIQVLANVGKASEAVAATDNGAEGIGLLRTEFLFGSRAAAPTEDEQTIALREVYAAIEGPLVVRTLDVGADKPLPFLPRPQEHNPYLGVRGIRLSLQTPELFTTQLRAILRSGVGRDLWVMFPMIAQLEEAQHALRVLQEAHEQLQRKGLPHAWPVKRGVMIEVPSAALITGQLAEIVDFFSIGTNDLTQYTMAAERGNAGVSQLQDALHPAVLRLIKAVVDGAGNRQRHVSVCGDAASDPASAAIFAGLGIASLSVRPKQVATIKELFRRVHLPELNEVARQALSCDSAAAVRSLIGHCLERSMAGHGDSVGAHEAQEARL